MLDCVNCKNAEWDYEAFSGATEKMWYVCGCLADRDPEQAAGDGITCEGFEVNDKRHG